MLKDLLEIILITYNRKQYLQKTLNALLAENSPVKDLYITILDNASTDGTSEYIAELAQKHPNLKHIRNAKNIGPNANIARMFELAQKPYFWPLCDDDSYDFSAWPEAEKALGESPDILVVNTEFSKGDFSFPVLFRLLTFLPAAIYKTANITPEVLININNNIPNWFPHLAAAAAVINKNGKITATGQNIVIRGTENDKIDFKKYENLENKTLPIINRFMPNLPPSQKYKTIQSAYYAACELIENPEKRAQAVAAYAPSTPFWRQVKSFIKWNETARNGCEANYLSAKIGFSKKQKYIFNLIYFFSHFLFFYFRAKRVQENKKTS